MLIPAAPDTIVNVAIPDSEIYRALFDLSQSIAGHSDLKTLCDSLAVSLRQVVSFDSLALALHDPVRDELRLHAVSTNRPYEGTEVVVAADDDHVGARVWREQKPLVLSPLENEILCGDEVRQALDKGIHALILVPFPTEAEGSGFSVSALPSRSSQTRRHSGFSSVLRRSSQLP